MMDNHNWRDARIEEAAKALCSAENAGEASWGMTTQDSRDWYRSQAVTALAVFEKALGEATVTPTDDELEALIAELLNGESRMRFEQADAAGLANALFAAGFRRTVVPEPSTDATCEHGTPLTDLCEHVERLVNAEPQGEPRPVAVCTTPPGIRLVPVGGRRAVDVAAEVADNRKWVRLHEHNKYQREAAKRITRLLNLLESAVAMRPALRAASAAGQGENR